MSSHTPVSRVLAELSNVFRVHTFFATFTSFRLFREPVFWEDLSQTSSELPVRALLTAMIAFSVNHMCGKTLTGYEQFSSSDFMEQAVRDVGAALTECGDDPPPLCLLQALILVTHGLLIRGVRGRAWRHLGLCIRIALELNLYAVDANKDPNACSTDVEQWCKEEEQRRAYWAIWEMDQFANHLKHIPMTVDWTQNYVLLPAEDEKWFRGQPQRSCFLDSDLITRSKTLHATGNKSDRAWYIVMASLNPEAHDLAYPSERIYRASGLGKVVFDNKDGEPSKEWICSILFNAIQLCTILLPPELKFHGQYLEFGTRTFGKGTDSASLHSQSSIYLLAMMPEIARLLALRPYVVEAFARKFLDTTDKDERCKSMREPSTRSQGATREVTQCRNAAEAVLNIVANCHEKHYQYVNPYVASASWLAATTNLLLQELSEDQSEKSMIRARFEVLKATNDRFIQYWDMSTVPKQNLDTLANKLKQFTAHPENVAKRRDENRSESASAGTRLGSKSPPSVGRPARYTRKDCGRHGGDTHTPSGSRRISGQAQAAVVVVAAAAVSSSALSSLSPRNRTNVGMDAGQTQEKNVALDSSAHMHVQGVAAAMDAVLSPDQVFEPTMHSNLDSDFGLGDRNVSLLSHNPCTRAHGLIAGTGSEQDYATTSHWEAPELEQSHIQGTTNSNPSDWFSFYPDAEFGGDLLEYFDVFSGPFLG